MGTVLSLSPGSRKASLYEDDAGSLSHYASVQGSKSAGSQKDRNAKRHPMFIPTLTWKRLVASTKKRGTKKGSGALNNNYQKDVAHLNSENVKKSLSCANLSSFDGQPLAPLSSTKEGSSSKKVTCTNYPAAGGEVQRSPQPGGRAVGSKDVGPQKPNRVGLIQTATQKAEGYKSYAQDGAWRATPPSSG
ncbi:CD5R1 kinase, partial [Polypterus senegalus]|nr:CD5R1 kinase [Polypterus senegalus]